jgi:hypothetical protein
MGNTNYNFEPFQSFNVHGRPQWPKPYIVKFVPIDNMLPINYTNCDPEEIRTINDYYNENHFDDKYHYIADWDYENDSVIKADYTLLFKRQKEVYNWCLNNSNGKFLMTTARVIRNVGTWQWQYHNHGLDHIFIGFTNEQDYFLFCLKWHVR